MSEPEHTPRIQFRADGDDEFKPLGHLNFDTLNLTVDETDSEVEPGAEPFVTDWNSKPVTVEMDFTKVDPDLLDLLTGGALTGEPEATHSLEVHGFRKRKWWQWLLRRPRQPYHVYFPNVRIERVSGNE